MNDLIKQVALDIANKLDPERAELGGDFQFGFNTVQLFAELVVAELSKRAEAVAYKFEDGSIVHLHDMQFVGDKTGQKVWPCFTFPAIHDIEAIENRVAEAICEMLRHKDKNCFGAHNYYLHAANCVEEGEWRKYK